MCALGLTFPISKTGLVGSILVIKEDQGLESVEHIVGAQKNVSGLSMHPRGAQFT